MGMKSLDPQRTLSTVPGPQRSPRARQIGPVGSAAQPSLRHQLHEPCSQLHTPDVPYFPPPDGR